MNLCVVCVNLFVICAKFKALQNALWLAFWGVLQFATLQNALQTLWREICALSEYCKFSALGVLREFCNFSVVFENFRSEICVFGAFVLWGVLCDKSCVFGVL